MGQGSGISKNPSDVEGLSSEMKYDIMIEPRDVNGVDKTFMMTVQPSQTIDGLKKKIYQRHKVCLPDSFELRWNNEKLPGNISLMSEKINKGVTLVMVPVPEDTTNSPTPVDPNSPIQSVLPPTVGNAPPNHQPSQTHHDMGEAEILLKRGNAFASQRKLEDAIGEYTKSLTLRPDYVDALNNRSACYSDLKQSEKSIGDLIRILEIEENNLQTLFLLGNAYYRQQEWLKAIHFYERCLQVEPTHFGSLSVGALAFRKLGQVRKALEWLNKLLQLHPTDSKGRYNRARVYTDLKHYKKAKLDLEELLKNEPNHKSATIFLCEVNRNLGIVMYFSQGLKCAEQHKYPEALKHFRDIIQLDPGNADAYGNMGYIHLRLGEYLEGVQCSTQAIETQESRGMAVSSAFYHNRAMCYRNMKNFAKAIHDFNKYITLIPRKKAHPFSYRGDCYSEIGDYENAFRDFDEAVRLNPREQSTYIHRGNAYDRIQKYKEAVRDFSQAINVDPRNKQTYFAYVYRGNVRVELLEHDEAMKDYNEAIKIDPTHRLAYHHKENLEEKMKKENNNSSMIKSNFDFSKKDNMQDEPAISDDDEPISFFGTDIDVLDVKKKQNDDEEEEEEYSLDDDEPIVFGGVYDENIGEGSMANDVDDDDEPISFFSDYIMSKRTEEEEKEEENENEELEIIDEKNDHGENKKFDFIEMSKSVDIEKLKQEKRESGSVNDGGFKSFISQRENLKFGD